ncbi:MAG: hypothetical protein MRK02_07885 [Candidatus Scalindua sp.]|nr:hypothetical protein [Candidatus Scalindua sp.]
MQKVELLNEIKLMELKLHALKAQIRSEEPKLKTHTTSSLYGLLKGSEEITTEDINDVKLRLKETL